MGVKLKWVGYSNDLSYKEESEGTFETEQECYNDMRDAVLSKMKWNTEWDEDFDTHEDYVDYRVHFEQSMIVHSSYSGCYVYLIIKENERGAWQDVFTKEMITYLTNEGYMAGYQMQEVLNTLNRITEQERKEKEKEKDAKRQVVLTIQSDKDATAKFLRKIADSIEEDGLNGIDTIVSDMGSVIDCEIKEPNEY